MTRLLEQELTLLPAKVRDKVLTGQLTGADVLAWSLVKQGVRRFYEVTGANILPTEQALIPWINQGSIRAISARTEEGAAFAALGETEVSRQPGVVLVTSGPGTAHLLAAVAAADKDGIPSVFITGQVSTDKIGTKAFQELPTTTIFTPITSWAYQIRDSAPIPYIVAKAFDVTKRAQKPVILDVPRNIQTQRFTGTLNDLFSSYHRSSPPLITNEVIRQTEQLTRALDDANRPIIIAGRGIGKANAQDDLLAFVEKGQIPFITTLPALPLLPQDHCLSAGWGGTSGETRANNAIKSADVVVTFATRLADRFIGNPTIFAPNARLIRVDINPETFLNEPRPEIGIATDVKTILKAGLPMLQERNRDDWINQIGPPHIKKAIKTPYSTMDYIISQFSDIAPEEITIVVDNGNIILEMARYFRFTRKRQLIISPGDGPMGHALPAAVGAKFAAPERPTVAIIGDGAFQMSTMSELGTVMQAAHEGLISGIFGIIICDDGGYGMVRELPIGAHPLYTDRMNPDFVMLHQAYGIAGEQVIDRPNVQPALNRMLNANKPYCNIFKIPKSPYQLMA